MIRIDVNIAARNVREMAMNPDTSTYAGYKSKVDEKLANIEEELEAMKNTGLVDAQLEQSYEDALHAWEKIGYEIIALVESGDIDGAQAQIISECAPALDKVIAISQEIDLLTDEMMNDSVAYSQLVFFVGVGSILLFIIIAVILAMRIGKYIVKSITEPLVEVEKVAVELSEGNFAVDALVECKCK